MTQSRHGASTEVRDFVSMAGSDYKRSREHPASIRGALRGPFTAFFTLRLKEPSLFHASRCSVCCVPRALRIIDGREQECSPSAALSLHLEEPRVLFRISSSGPCEPAVVLQKVSILELLRQLAA